MITAEQLNKLPKYAQEEIEHLQQRVRELESEIAGLFGKEPTGLSYETFSSRKPLPKYSHVIFRLSDAEYPAIECQMDEHGGKVAVEIRAQSHLSSNMVLEPVGGNVVRISCS